MRTGSVLSSRAPRLLLSTSVTSIVMGLSACGTSGPDSSVGAGGGSNAGGGSSAGSGGGPDTAGSGGRGVGFMGGGAGAGGDGSGGLNAAGGTASGGGVGSGGSVSVVGEIMDIVVEPNPNSVLSAYVSWTTPEASSSVVQFGEGDLAWQVEGEASVTEHRVLVIGMRATKTYAIRAISDGPQGRLQGDASFVTSALPAQIPIGVVSVHDPLKAQPGWTLMNVQKGDGSTSARAGAPPAAVIYDEEGQPVWYFIHGTVAERGGAISVDRTDNGVLMGATATMDLGTNATGPTECDWAGDVIWTCPDTKCGGAATLSHHSGKLKSGHYVTMRDTQDGARTSQVFEELDPAQGGAMVHSIGVLDGLPTPPAGASGDWAHGNAIVVDLDNDFAYMNFRWLGLMKMKYSTKELIWHLPAKYGEDQLGKFTNKVLTFNPPASQYSDTHDPEIHADGTILFFDNGGFTGQIAEGNPGNLHTRVLEYRIDEAESQATLTWEWPGDASVDAWYKEDFYVPFWGGVHSAENGNVLIAAGRRGTGSTTPESRVIEVEKASKEVVWELILPKDHGIYRAERLFPLPLVKKIGE